MNILKGIGALIVGFLVVVILSTATDYLLELLRIFPPLGVGYFGGWMAATALAYRTLFTIFAGYLTAMLAPTRQMRWVVILGIIGLLAGTAGVITTWGKGLGPEWYPIGIAVLAFPSVWLGGWLKLRGKKEA